jgi:hypothetical protein
VSNLLAGGSDPTAPGETSMATTAQLSERQRLRRAGKRVPVVLREGAVLAITAVRPVGRHLAARVLLAGPVAR